MKYFFICLVGISCLTACRSEQEAQGSAPAMVKNVGAMKEVMWKGELFGKIRLDTIADKSGLYGIGPLTYLRGEILINDGRAFASRVLSDSSMLVEESYEIEAPFLVYANVKEWETSPLPASVEDLQSLEAYLIEKTQAQKEPFVFKLIGSVASADIHIQNLAEGSSVSSPQEAHQGQQSYSVANTEVEIIGFFSKHAQGIYTHHDTFMHMHLISKDGSKMGHLDRAKFEEMKLFLALND
ncbi:MAG: acetolactate decarboxylase [Bacteroidota bacterium]